MGRVSSGCGATDSLDMERLGADGCTLMPPMIYRSPDPRESLHQFRAGAKVTGLPIMICNNPIRQGHDLTPELFAELAAHEAGLGKNGSTLSAELRTALRFTRATLAE